MGSIRGTNIRCPDEGDGRNHLEQSAWSSVLTVSTTKLQSCESDLTHKRDSLGFEEQPYIVKGKPRRLDNVIFFWVSLWFVCHVTKLGNQHISQMNLKFWECQMTAHSRCDVDVSSRSGGSWLAPCDRCGSIGSGSGKRILGGAGRFIIGAFISGFKISIGMGYLSRFVTIYGHIYCKGSGRNQVINITDLQQPPFIKTNSCSNLLENTPFSRHAQVHRQVSQPTWSGNPKQETTNEMWPRVLHHSPLHHQVLTLLPRFEGA